MLLADDLVQSTWTHPNRQGRTGSRPRCGGVWIVVIVIVSRREQILHATSLVIASRVRYWLLELGSCAVIQVVSQASVTVEKQRIGEITGPGLMILLGVHVDATQKQADALVNKIFNCPIIR